MQGNDTAVLYNSALVAPLRSPMSAPVAMDLGASPDVLLSQDPASEQRPVTAARDPPHGISADVEPPTNSDRASPVKHVYDASKVPVHHVSHQLPIADQTLHTTAL